MKKEEITVALKTAKAAYMKALEASEYEVDGMSIKRQSISALKREIAGLEKALLDATTFKKSSPFKRWSVEDA